MASTFFFRAVASDGKVRTGSLTGEDEGLTPIYVGIAPRSNSFGGRRRRDVLFFTQELSTLFGGVGLQACAGRPRPAARESC
jgi:general secretion pathway protein F